MENLQLVKAMLEGAMKDEPIIYKIQEVWMDFGAGIKHTTIVAYPYLKDRMSWQIFSPRDLKEIDNGEYTLDSLKTLVNQHKEKLK